MALGAGGLLKAIYYGWRGADFTQGSCCFQRNEHPGYRNPEGCQKLARVRGKGVVHMLAPLYAALGYLRFMMSARSQPPPP